MSVPQIPVSVVIPCYRCEATLERALASVASQTSIPIEVILVDDGNPSSTKSELERLRLRYSGDWVKVLVLPENQGAANARNFGWNQARGDYIAFLDADDAWHPAKLNYQYQFMLQHPNVDVTGHGFVYGNVPQGVDALEPCRHMSVALVSPWTVVLKNPFITPSIMLKRGIGLRFERGHRHMEDHLLLMQLAMRGAAIAYLPCALAVIFKAQFGAGGLSGDLRAMYKAEQSNLRNLIIAGDVPRALGPVLTSYFFLKYLRRWLIVWLRSRGLTAAQKPT